MYAPVGYEAYGEYDVFPNSQEALLPPENTIARGHSLYAFEDTNDCLLYTSPSPRDS